MFEKSNDRVMNMICLVVQYNHKNNNRNRNNDLIHLIHELPSEMN